MKVLFLDIDGVLNDIQFIKDNRGQIGKICDPSMLDPYRIKKLNDILNDDIKVVLSSSCRIIHDISVVQEFLTQRGFKYKLYDSTPVLCRERHMEIKKWIESHIVEQFAILDDTMEAGVGLESHFVYIKDGLEDEHVNKAIDLLKG